MFTEDAQVGDRALKGILYLLVRFIRNGIPCYNDLDGYLLDTQGIDVEVANDIVQTFQKGFGHHGIDHCRMIFEATVDWQGYVPGEIKLLW